ncbi:tetratricopeptide repeat protein [Kitasatospora sp. NBC_00374]|uniref:tetratricopeptide repeat protein n=1 Tax=Kitasatospora sp. NBC_00374 TaxID=2975964 RepID=UPI003255EEB3
MTEQQAPGTGPGSGDAIASGVRAIAINTLGAPFTGIASTGDNTTIIYVPQEELRPAAKVDAPPKLVSLQVRHASFVGRARELALLDAALDGGGTVVVQALHGLGGVGKTALAAHWAATRTGVDNPVWWITADSPASIDTGLAELAATLQPALAQLPAEQLAERAKQWLATHSGWLLVLDNVDNPDHLAPLLARATTGRILITSRRSTGWHDTAVPVPLDVLASEEALELLTRILTRGGTGTADLDGAAELCHELGGLPLAIEQAGAYIAETGITARTYLSLLADDPADMYQETAAGRDSERAVARVWSITLDRLTDVPLAGHLLRVLAWWAPDGIPRNLLSPLGSAPAVLRAIGHLSAYSMITIVGDGTLSVHRLLQALTRTPDPHDPHRQDTAINAALLDATRLLDEARPGSPEDPGAWARWRVLLPHVDALSHHAPPSSDTAATAALLSDAGLFLHVQGQVSRATVHLERSLAGRLRALGEDDSATLASRNYLGRAYVSAGAFGRAIPLIEQTLADSLRVLGDDHPDTLSSRSNLAYTYEAAGGIGRAIPLYERTLADRVRVLGEKHHDTLLSRHNLASAYQAAGDLRRAIPLYEQTLSDMLRVLGVRHPLTLAFLNNLAVAYTSAGDFGRAIPLYEQTLAARTRVLGADHPATLATRNNLAHTYGQAGDLGRAIPLLEQTLDDTVRVLGDDHPDTLGSRNNLAHAYEAAGDFGRAIPLLEQTLDDMVRVLGDDHPDTLGARNNLAYTYDSAGDLDRAVPLYERTLDGMVQVLGENHPNTFTARNNLAYVYAQAGDLSRAILLLEQTLADRIRVQGEDHPETLLARHNLTYVYQSVGDLNHAIPLLEQTLANRIHVLGENHPDTHKARNNLAHAYRSAAEAEGVRQTEE